MQALAAFGSATPAAAEAGGPVLPLGGCERSQRGPLWLELAQPGLLLFTTRKVLTNRRVMHHLSNFGTVIRVLSKPSPPRGHYDEFHSPPPTKVKNFKSAKVFSLYGHSETSQSAFRVHVSRGEVTWVVEGRGWLGWRADVGGRRRT